MLPCQVHPSSLHISFKPGITLLENDNLKWQTNRNPKKCGL